MLIASLNQIFFIICMVVNIMGFCSIIKCDMQSLTQFCGLLGLETVGAGILLYMDTIDSQYFIIDEKKYFIWASSVIFVLFNIYFIVTICKFRSFLNKLFKQALRANLEEPTLATN